VLEEVGLTAGERPRPEGIQWVRDLLRSLAAEGRTVFVSSHLMSEMSQTADHLVVIGRGRLIADASVADVIGSASANHMRVVSSQAAALVGNRLARLVLGSQVILRLHGAGAQRGRG